MKKFFLSMLAVAALVSCSNEEVLEVNKGEAISFSNAFVDNATRATDPSYSNNDITAFTVYGTVNNVVIYPGSTVTKGDAGYGAAWTCDVEQYWIAGANYKFIGIVDGAKANVTETTIENGMPTAIKYTADGKTDLLCQTITKTANTDGTSNGLVAFEFAHLLSKINFTVNNDAAEANGYTFVVRDIKFTGATEATYNVTNAAWGDVTKNGDTSLSQLRVTEGVTSVELTDEVLFIPGNYSISFTVDLYYGEVSDANLISSTPYSNITHTLVAATAYNFNVTVGLGEKIQFTVTKQPTWTDGGDVDIN
jgi:hypothetical protein